MDPEKVIRLTKSFLIELISMGEDVELSSVLRPDNVLISEEGIKLKDPMPAAPFVPVDGFAAPEQYVAGDSERAPVYFVGALMYTLLKGGPPPDVRTRLANDQLLQNDGTPLVAVINHCLALHPDKRYANLNFVLEALQKISGDDGAEAAKALKTGAYSESLKPKKKGKKGLLVAVLIVLVLAVGVLGYTLWQGARADDALEAGNYADVTTILDRTPWLKTSRQQSYDYATAMQYWQGGNYEGALGLLDGLNGYADSAEVAKKVRYDKALGLLQVRRLEEAKAVFDELGDYEDSAAQSAQITEYLAAEALADPLTRYEVFGSFGDYLDSRQNAIKAGSEVQEAAMAAYTGGDFLGASSLFTALGNFEDAPIYGQICDLWLGASDSAEENRALLPMVLGYDGMADLEPVLMSDRFFMVFLEGEWTSEDGGETLVIGEDEFSAPVLPTAGRNWAFRNRSINNADGAVAVFGYTSPNEVTMTVSESGETYTYQRQTAE